MVDRGAFPDSVTDLTLDISPMGELYPELFPKKLERLCISNHVVTLPLEF